MPLLRAEGLTKVFGGITALNNVDISVEKGTIVGLIGPNGAGKTTLFNAIAGAFRLSAGRVLFDDEDITGFSASRVCRRGVARTFQVTRPFAEMSCLENVAVAIVNNREVDSRAKIENLARECLGYVGLGDLADSSAGNLNVVQKKKLEIARTLGTDPKLILLDEVLGGLNSQEIQDSIEFIKRLRDERGLTILWIEHVMGAIMQAAEKVIVLDQGAVLMEGDPDAVVNDPRVIHAYLGE